MKKLVVPVFGLLLAACTYQFAPTGSERPDFDGPAASTATAGISLPSAPDTDDGGNAPPSPPSPDPGGGGGGMPDFPDFPGGGG